jgi:hypothetical protein
MQVPLLRPGRVDGENTSTTARVVARFANASQGNMVIQQVVTMGALSAGLGVTGPERMPDGQGMLLSIPCPNPTILAHVEALCRSQGAQVMRQAASHPTSTETS